MAQYQITVDGEPLHQLLRGDDGAGKLLEGVRNQVLEAQVAEHTRRYASPRSGYGGFRALADVAYRICLTRTCHRLARTGAPSSSLSLERARVPACPFSFSANRGRRAGAS